MDEHTPQERTFARELRAHRKAFDLSQAALSLRSCVSLAWIRNLERGYETKDGKQILSRPSPKTAVQLANALGWDPADALAVAGHDPTDIPEIEYPTLANLTSRLGVREKRAVEALLAAMAAPQAS